MCACRESDSARWNVHHNYSPLLQVVHTLWLQGVHTLHVGKPIHYSQACRNCSTSQCYIQSISLFACAQPVQHTYTLHSPMGKFFTLHYQGFGRTSSRKGNAHASHSECKNAMHKQKLGNAHASWQAVPCTLLKNRSSYFKQKGKAIAKEN